MAQEGPRTLPRRLSTSAKDNYYTEDGGAFAAVRIPEAREGRAVAGSLVGRSRASYTELKAAEKDALAAVRAYDQGIIGIDDAMERITTYDSMLGARVYEQNPGQRGRLYRSLLRSRATLGADQRRPRALHESNNGTRWAPS